MAEPDEKLAERILDKLVDEKLLSAKEAKKLGAPLAEGEIGQDDWKVAFENSANEGGQQ